MADFTLVSSTLYTLLKKNDTCLLHEIIGKQSNALKLFATTLSFYCVASSHVKKIVLRTTHRDRLTIGNMLAVQRFFYRRCMPDNRQNVTRVQRPKEDIYREIT